MECVFYLNPVGVWNHCREKGMIFGTSKGKNMPDTVPIVPASTILLCRNAPELEVFMVVRHHQIDFASGALVFPGGKVDAADSDAVAAQNARGLDEHPEEEHAFLIASIREVFEECGVLLARDKGSDKLISASRLEALMPYQERLGERRNRSW